MVPVDEARWWKRVRWAGADDRRRYEQGTLFHDAEMKDAWPPACRSATGSARSTIGRDRWRCHEKPLFSGAELRKRQIAAGYSIEELEQILAPMAEDGKEALARMGDDTPSAVLSTSTAR